MRALSPSEIAAARIPKITDLRDQLDYGDARLSRCTAFVDDLRVFRRRYSTMGLRGTELWDWKSPEHQAALKEMTASFLDEYEYGEVYWPSDPAAPNFNSLQYSKDRTFITQTVRQLIFKLNLQQYRNNKYKKKEHQDSRDNEIVDSEDEGLPTNTLPENTPNNEVLRPNSSHINTFTRNYMVVPSTTSDHEPEKSRLTKRKLDAQRKVIPSKRTKMVASTYGIFGHRIVDDEEQIMPKAQRLSPQSKKTAQRPYYADPREPAEPIAVETTTAELTSDDEDDLSGHQADIRQSSEHIEDVLRYIRTNRPSVTSEGFSPTPVIRPTKPTHDSHIDPNLERIVPQSSATHRPKPAHASSKSSTITTSRKKVQPGPQHFPSPAPTVSTIEVAHDTVQQTAASPAPIPASRGAQASLISGPKSSPAASSTPATASSTPPKAGIDFNYIVILSRAPVYQYKTWKPRGHFMEKSLSELVAELPFENKKDIQGLTIRLEGPGAAVEETLNCDEDAKFDDTKGRFLKTVKMCHKNNTKANPGKLSIMNFEIEAVREGGVEEEDDDDDDIVF